MACEHLNNAAATQHSTRMQLKYPAVQGGAGTHDNRGVMPPHFTAVALVLAAFSLPGCSLIDGGGSTQGKPKENLTMQETADRAEHVLDDTLAGVKPAVDAARGPSSDSVCTDLKNDGTGTGALLVDDTS